MMGVWVVLSAKEAGFSCTALCVEALEALAGALYFMRVTKKRLFIKRLRGFNYLSTSGEGCEIEQPFVRIKVFRLFWTRVWRLGPVMSPGNLSC